MSDERIVYAINIATTATLDVFECEDFVLEVKARETGNVTMYVVTRSDLDGQGGLDSERELVLRDKRAHARSFAIDYLVQHVGEPR